MGEGEKKTAEVKKQEKTKVAPTTEDGKKEKAPEKADEKAPPPEAVKREENKSEESKEEQPPQPPSPSPQEIVLRVFMHCEGCARKVRRCLKGFDGVEDVIADCRTSKVIVKGEKADPLKVLERVQKKSHRKVELISPIPKPPPSEEKPQEQVATATAVVKPDDVNKEEPAVITVVMGVYMHCDACSQEIKRRIMRMKGVEIAEPDLKSSQVKVKGVFEPQQLIDYVYKRTGKHAVIIKAEPEKKEEKKSKEIKENEKKKNEEGEKQEQVANENKDAGAGSVGEQPAEVEAEVVAPVEDPTRLELRKNEFYYYNPQNYQMYPPRYAQDMNAYPPQIFSDDNPNACTVM